MVLDFSPDLYFVLMPVLNSPESCHQSHVINHNSRLWNLVLGENYV